MLLDIGASFLKWQIGNEYHEERFMGNITQLQNTMWTEDVYIATQANAFVDQHGNIHNWGYEPTKEDIPLEEWLKRNTTVKYVGNDYEMAVYGADLHEGEILLNLGTGGQATMFGVEQCYEQLTIHGQRYTTIRYIPCGKILARLNHLLNVDVYGWINMYHLSDIDLQGLSCNPAWHEMQSKYPGSFKGITLENFTSEKIIQTTFMGILTSFNNAIKDLCFQTPFVFPPNVKLAGGIAEKCPLVQEYFHQYYKNVEIIPHATFRGLERIMKEGIP